MSKKSDGTPATESSNSPTVSGDGRYIAFSSYSQLAPNAHINIYPGVYSHTIYVHDTVLKTTEVVNLAADGTTASEAGYSPQISADGRHVGFTSWATDLVDDYVGYQHHVYVRDLDAGNTVQVSVDSSGNPSNGHCGHSTSPSLSADARYIAFACDATNLDPRDTDSNSDVFVHDTQLGTTQLVGLNKAGNHPHAWGRDSHPHISTNGRYVVFQSTSNLAPGDSDFFKQDIYLRDMVAGITELISVSTTNELGNQESRGPSVSDDGRYVMFSSDATNLVADDTNGVSDVFYRDRIAGTTSRVSVDSAGGEANDRSHTSSLSGSGRYVSFVSYASNLVAEDTNGKADIFVRDMQTEETRRISLSNIGGQGDGSSTGAAVSNDGRYIVFQSSADNLIPGDTNGVTDIFIRAVPSPKVSSVSPRLLPIEATTTITITGVDFLPDTYIAITDAQVNNLQVVDETTITADITVPAGVNSGSRSLVVMVLGTGAGAETGSTALCSNCLTFF